MKLGRPYETGIAALLACALAAAPSGCENTPPLDVSAQGPVGAEGGSVKLDEGSGAGASVSVPPHALDQPTNLTVSVAAPAAGLPEGLEAVGPTIELGPSGTVFAAPVIITIPARSRPTALLTRDAGESAWTVMPGAAWDPARGVMVAETSHFSVYVAVGGTPTGISFPSMIVPAVLCSGPAAAAPVDFNADGKLDLVLGCNDGSVSAYLGKGTGGFASAATVSAQDRVRSVTAGDFTGDGRPDIAFVTFSPSGFPSKLGVAAGATGGALVKPVYTDAGLGDPRRIVAADFDGDGKLDVAIADLKAQLRVLRGKGDGTFAPPSTITTAGAPLRVVAADFNRDGRPDLAVSHNFSAQISVLLNKGDGTFAAATVSAVIQPSTLVADDYNDDGRADLFATAYTATGTNLIILAGNGDGTFAAAKGAATQVRTQDLLSGDFNFDGRLDTVFVRDYSIQANSGDGMGAFPRAIDFGGASLLETGVVGDYTGDGKLDVIAFGTAFPKLYVFLNATTGTPKFNDLSMRDLAATPDLAMPDLATPDLAMPDLATPDLAAPDLKPPPDLAAPPDLTPPPPAPTCQALKQAMPGAPDGEYTLFVGGDKSKPWTAWCKDMAGTPREYLTLKATGTANYSQYTAKTGQGTNVRTSYTRVRIDPITLKVDPNDQTYSTSVGMLDHGGPVTSMPFGVAMDCIDYGSATGVANITLTGTPFAVAPSQFALGGSTPAGIATYRDDGRVVDLTGGGGCGWNAVAGSNNPFNKSGLLLQLVYKPIAPVATCQALKQVMPGAPDGEYTLYAGGDPSKPWTAWCKDMAGTPKEYLILKVTGTANYSQYTAKTGQGTHVRTSYSRVRIDPITLKVDPNDQTYSTSAGMLDHGGPVTSMPFGVAMDCVNWGSSTGVANIDLSGVPFVVAPNQLALGGSTPAGTTTYRSGGRVVDLTGGGGCGWNAVAGSNNPFNKSGLPLQLTYLPFTGPMITAVSPDTVVNTGGAALTLTGVNFASGATITIGGTIGGSACGNVVVASTARITCTAPARAAACGPQPLTIKNPDGQEFTAPGLLRYRSMGGTVSFQTATTLPTGTAPDHVLALDVNGDGRIDLVNTNRGTHDVTVRLGAGDGTFGASSAYPVGKTPIGLVAGDFNGDGRIDVAAANYTDNTVGVLVNTGMGGTSVFAPVKAVAAGSLPIDLDAGDVNADGKLDLVVGNNNSPDTVVLLGDGMGGLALKTTVKGGGDAPQGVRLGDLDRDGKLDLVAANYLAGNFDVHKGAGDGTFGPALTRTTGAGPLTPALGDFNTDGKLDVAVTNLDGNSVSVFLGDGALGFASPRTIPGVGSPRGILAADFNADGIVDLALGNAGGAAMTILVGAGDGTFGSVMAGGAQGSMFVTAADFNADGVLDLAATAANNLLAVALGACK